MSSRCPVTELETAWCDHCRSVAKPRRPEPVRTRWFEARHAGCCVRCGQLFSLGAWIAYDRETGLFIAECCDPAEAAA